MTGVGGVGGTSTVRWLREHTAHAVVGVDANPRARGFLLLDRWETVPAAEASEWPAAVAGVVDRHDVDVVVPLVDEELARLRDLREALPSAVPVVAPAAGAVDRTLDKRRFDEWAAGTDLPVPRSARPDDASDLVDASLDFPVVVKPRMGHGSAGVERIESPAALAASFERRGREPADVVVQEVVEGTEFTTSVVATGDDELLAVVPKAVIEKDGNTGWGVTREHAGVTRTCRRLHGALRPHGPVNVQQIVDEETGEARIVEVNPRFSSTACLTAAAGVDELDLLVRDALGESIAPPDGFEPGVHLIRSVADRFAAADPLEAPPRRIGDAE